MGTLPSADDPGVPVPPASERRGGPPGRRLAIPTSEVPLSQPIATIPPATQPADARAPGAEPIAAVAWDGGAAVIIDQRQLPGTLVHWRLSTVDAVVEAIRTLAVRGA